MTWKEIKVAAFQKMGSSENGSVDFNADENRDALAAMPQACNEALQYVCDTAKPYRKHVTVTVTAGARTMLISDIVQDYAHMGAMEVYRMTDGVPEETECTIMADKYISFYSDGTFEWWYDAKPEPVTDNTADSYEFPYDPDVCVILPLYIASEVNKNDDDEGLCTTYRNEFEVAVDALRKRIAGQQTGAFYSLTGWC